MHQEPSETPSCRLNPHRVILRSLCCILFLLLAGCASSTASSPTGTAGTSIPTAAPTMAPTATPTPNIPTLSTALLTYKGHSKAILGFAWSPDAKEIVSGGDDGTVQMWDTKTGKRLWNYDTGTYVFVESRLPLQISPTYLIMDWSIPYNVPGRHISLEERDTTYPHKGISNLRC